MADIKTRESLHTVKTFDRVQNLAAKTRNGVDEAKQEINDTISSGESSERRVNMREIVLKHTKAERRILPFVPVIELADGVSEKHAAIFKNGETDRKK